MPNVSDSTRQVFKWVGLIGTIIFGIATGLSFVSYRNGRKSLLAKIDRYNQKD